MSVKFLRPIRINLRPWNSRPDPVVARWSDNGTVPGNSHDSFGSADDDGNGGDGYFPLSALWLMRIGSLPVRVEAQLACNVTEIRGISDQFRRIRSNVAPFGTASQASVRELARSRWLRRRGAPPFPRVRVPQKMCAMTFDGVPLVCQASLPLFSRQENTLEKLLERRDGRWGRTPFAMASLLRKAATAEMMGDSPSLRDILLKKGISPDRRMRYTCY